MDLVQFTDRSEVEVQIFRVELEAFCQLMDCLLELHQGNSYTLDLRRRQSLFFEAPDGLPLHQLANEFDEAEDELDDRPLDIFGIRIPPERRGSGARWAPSGSCTGTFTACWTLSCRPSFA